jgi:hypothetical protein
MAAHEIQPEANETTSNEVTHSQLWQSLLDLVPRQLPSAPDLMFVRLRWDRLFCLVQLRTVSQTSLTCLSILSRYAEVAPIFASVAQDALAELLEKGYQTNRKPIPPSTPFHPVQPTVKLPPSNTNVDLVKLHALFRSTTAKPLSKCYLQFYSGLLIHFNITCSYIRHALNSFLMSRAQNFIGESRNTSFDHRKAQLQTQAPPLDVSTTPILW